MTARYSRQSLLPEVGADGQDALAASTVLVVGCGGLGSAVSLYLAAAGVGALVLADGDRVEDSNLQRQIAHTEASLGQNKAVSAAAAARARNGECHVTALDTRLDAQALADAAREADLVCDCSDNFPTRYAVNDACLAARKPLVSGAAVRLEGQVVVFHPGRGGSPCYRCLFPDTGTPGEACEDAGILGPVVGVIGALQAVEAIKQLLGLDPAAAGRLSLYDARGCAFRQIRVAADPDCATCGEPR